MSIPLRGDEILSCRHRVALSRGSPVDIVRAPASEEMERRRRLANEYRREVLDYLAGTSGARVTTSTHDTVSALDEGVALILSPRLPDDVVGHRRASMHTLVRLGNHDGRYVYAPLIVKNSEAVEPSKTRRLLTTTSLVDESWHQPRTRDTRASSARCW